MIVKELIEQLQVMPQYAKVLAPDMEAGGCVPVVDVEYIKEAGWVVIVLQDQRGEE